MSEINKPGTKSARHVYVHVRSKVSILERSV